MVKIQQPQRFYQLSYLDEYDDNTIETIIDLKYIAQISFKSENVNLKEKIIIKTILPQPEMVIIIKENECGSEVYSKLVTAWTTYKLAAEN